MNLKTSTTYRAAKYFAAFLAAWAFTCLAVAQAVSTTTVQGTVYLASGKPGSGSVQISWPAFSTANNLAIAAGRTSVSIGSDGFLSVNLTPNLGASPAGLFYTAVYHMSDGTTSTEYWVVPAAAQASPAQVRAQVMPAAQAVQAVSKAYVDQAIQSLAQGSLTPVGGTLSGPLYLNGDPTQSLQAADKHYVDTSFSQALPLSGGSATGPLTATQLGAAWQVDQFPGGDFGAKLQACLAAISSTYGGTCDARNFTGALSMASSVTIFTANTTVQLPCATISTASQLIVPAATRNVSLHGCALRGSSAASGTQGGTVFLYSGAASMIKVGDPTYAADTQGFHLDNVVINTTSANNSTAQALIAYRTQELDLQSLYLLGNSNQTGITLDGTGNYTGGTFYDNAISGFQTAVNAIGHQSANPATTDWLNASTFVRLHINCPTANGNPLAGTTGINLAQGDGNTITGGDVEGCATALHLGANAQNNTILGLRNENSTSQIVADPGSSYNNWITGGTMFTGKLTDNGTRNSFLDTFHRSFNGMTGDWYGSQQDATVTNHFRLGIGNGNERGLYNRYQTDSGYRWTTGLSDAAVGEQFYQVLDELNNVYRLSIGQYNSGQPSTNNQTVVNAAGTGAVVLNGSNNSGTGGVVFGSGGSSETTVATISNTGNAQFNGTLQVGGPTTFTSSTTVRNQADAEIDQFLWAGVTASQKESYIYKDYTGLSQWYMVKDATNNWALNSALGGIDSFKAYQSNNSGDTYINAANASGVVRINYESGSGAQFKIYGGNSGTPYASFSGAAAIQFPGLAAAAGQSCLQIDNSGYISNSGAACGSGSTNGTVNNGSSGQIAYYSGNGPVVSGMSAVPVSSGGTGANTAAAALAALGGAALNTVATQTFSGPVVASSIMANVNNQLNVMVFGAKGDCIKDDSAAIQAAFTASHAQSPWNPIYFPVPPGGCYYVASALNWLGESLLGQPPQAGAGVVIKGAPGNDVLHMPDPDVTSIHTQNSWTIEHITFKVDDSVDASGTAPFQHRWPGRFASDGAMAANSAVLTTTKAFITCADIGQNVQINGAGASGANLVTTVSNVTPCYQNGTAPVITLATAANTTVTNATVYITPAGIPVTQHIGNCAIATSQYDGNSANWKNSGTYLAYDSMFGVVTESTTGSSTNNSCGIFFQGTAAPYGLDNRFFQILNTEWGLVEGVPDTNFNSSQYDAGADYQLWDGGKIGGAVYPWITYNGNQFTLKHIQLAASNGPQVLQSYSVADSIYQWNIAVPEMEQVTGTGWRIEGTGHIANGIELCSGGAAIIDTTDSHFEGGECETGTLKVYGLGNTIRMNDWVTNIPQDLGAQNNITHQYSASPYKGKQQNVPLLADPTRGVNYASGTVTPDFITSGNGANPYPNQGDLMFWPEDMYSPTQPFTYGTDSSSLTGRSFNTNAGALIGGTLGGFWNVGNTGSANNQIIAGTHFPAGKITLYVSMKCPSPVSATITATYNVNTVISTGPSGTCGTTYSTFSVTADYTTHGGQSFGFLVTPASGSVQVAWAAIRPFQGDYNGYQPAHGGVNSDITSLTGLTTPLTLAQGGTGNTTGNAPTATKLASNMLGCVDGWDHLPCTVYDQTMLSETAPTGSYTTAWTAASAGVYRVTGYIYGTSASSTAYSVSTYVKATNSGQSAGNGYLVATAQIGTSVSSGNAYSIVFNLAAGATVQTESLTASGSQTGGGWNRAIVVERLQ